MCPLLIAVLLEEIDKMERSQNGSNGHLHVNSLGETRSRLEKLIMRMDGLETTFDKMVEKTSTCLTSEEFKDQTLTNAFPLSI